jgi:hypothetical protein
MERIEDTEDDVDLRPRRPPEERRYDERGVSGDGEREGRLPDPWVDTLARFVTCVDGVTLAWCACTLELRFKVPDLRRESGDLLCGITGDFPLLALEPGERARFDVSFIQLRSDVRWFKNGGWYFRRRLGIKPLGCRRSGLLDTT